MKRKRHYTTADDITYILEHYATMSMQEIADARSMSKTTVCAIAHGHGLRKTREWIAERARLRSSDPNHGGRATRFQKGRTPFQKGKKIEEWMSPEGIANSVKGRFKKGRPSQNIRPVGSERVNVDGYIEIKIAEPSKWRQKQRVVWEAEHGPVPDGYMVSFIDGNKQNCALSNLRLITKADNLRRVSLNNYPDEVREVIHMRAVLKRHINTQKRKRDGNK